jgi:hypothetical protein
VGATVAAYAGTSVPDPDARGIPAGGVGVTARAGAA